MVDREAGGVNDDDEEYSPGYFPLLQPEFSLQTQIMDRIIWLVCTSNLIVKVDGGGSFIFPAIIFKMARPANATNYLAGEYRFWREDRYQKRGTGEHRAPSPMKMTMTTVDGDAAR